MPAYTLTLGKVKVVLLSRASFYLLARQLSVQVALLANTCEDVV